MATTMHLPLSRGLSTILDTADLPLIAAHNWCASGREPHIYAVTNLTATTGVRAQLSMHRLITDAAPTLVVDHINGNTLDNRRSNLRVCEHRLNIASSQSRTGASEFKGVVFDRERAKWKAQIKVNRQHRNLGRFGTEEEAARAYDQAALSAWGEFALTNFPIISWDEAVAHV